MPNVGKSCLFNALLGKEVALSANYPFATIKPNKGFAPVPDSRLDTLAALYRTQRRTAALIEYLDIAGLVKGASEGAGLGNQFLEAIRSVDLVVHLVRCFGDETIHHVEHSVDPLRDIQIIEDELILKDFQMAEGMQKKKPKGLPDPKAFDRLVGVLLDTLGANKAIRTLSFKPDEAALVKAANLITAKPILYCLNVDEASAATGNEYSKKATEFLEKEFKNRPVLLSARLEADIAMLESDPAKRRELYAQYGLKDSGLNSLVVNRFYTAGSKECRAWPVPRGWTARQCAGEIHTDMAEGFIKAETCAYNDLIAAGSEKAAREAKKYRLEGPTYAVKDGDILFFKFAN